MNYDCMSRCRQIGSTLRTSKKKEENDFKGSKGHVFVLRFVDFDPNYFCCYIFHFVTLVVMTGVDQLGNIHKIVFPENSSNTRETLACVKVAFCVGMYVYGRYAPCI